ncbi:MAG TPA: M14 family zinc carboxypeptidase [Bacteroidota bacterium]|nr:M14 family zinc carboxypeptidase [Bacteroidota bacterium]
MTPNALATHLFSTYEQYRLFYLRPANCRHREVVAELRELASRGGELFTLKEIGTSVEGRTIYRFSFGRGEKRVLLWSQMHGDESTATLALLDIFNMLAEDRGKEAWVGEMLEQTSVHVIPMLNPDGAERVQRHTAVQIDMNRDARCFATPEARVLRDAQRQLRPAYGFNLHDQGLSSVGVTGKVAALALLAPALDEKRSTPPVRLRAMRIGALITRALSQFVGGHIATYDDAYEPRAFGDGMQSWGTSTVLIESGHWPGDPDKLFIRKLNYIALLTALRAIGNGSYQDTEMDWYRQLLPNGKMMYDVVIRGVELHGGAGGWSARADIGLMYEPPLHKRIAKDAPVMVKCSEIGDLSLHGGLEEIDGGGRRMNAAAFPVDAVVPLSALTDALQIHYDRPLVRGC